MSDGNFSSELSTGVPPRLPSVPNRALAIKLIVTLSVTGVAMILFFFKPGQHAIYPVCQFHKLTGLHCPGCGGLRATHQLLHGEFFEAARLNLLFVLGVIGLAVRGGWVTWKKWRGEPANFFAAPMLWIFLGASVVFTVLRNLPAFSWLAP